jgi:hypothetical protein
MQRHFRSFACLFVFKKHKNLLPLLRQDFSLPLGKIGGRIIRTPQPEISPGCRTDDFIYDTLISICKAQAATFPVQEIQDIRLEPGGIAELEGAGDIAGD